MIRIEEKTKKVEKLLIEEPYISIRRIAHLVGISPTSAHTIIKKDLQLKLVCFKWIPKNLNKIQKEERASCSKKLLDIFENNEYELRKVIAVDETWISSYNVGSKRNRSNYVKKIPQKF